MFGIGRALKKAGKKVVGHISKGLGLRPDDPEALPPPAVQLEEIKKETEGAEENETTPSAQKKVARAGKAKLKIKRTAPTGLNI